MSSNGVQEVMVPTGTAESQPTKLAAVRRRWPAAAGLGFAALMASDLVAGVDLARVLGASAVIYLGAAALQRPRAAWPMFFTTVVILTVARIVDSPFDPTWAILGAGFVLIVYGLVRRALQPAYGLPLQTLALLGFGGAAALALFLSPDVGSYLVAAGLLGHAGWDLYHHRTNRVVVRSLAEFCLVLDVALALAIVAVTVLN